MPIFNGKCAEKFNAAILFLLLACLAPVIILALGATPKTSQSGMAGDYITLITGSQVQDSLITAKLSAAGLKNVLSESSQWFFINDFSELRRVPLDQFADFMLGSDPRNDGYAEKLRTVFTREGKRYFYIPRQSLHSSDPSVIERRVKEALDGEPYSAVIFNSYTVQNSGGGLVFMMSAIASLILAIYAAKPFSGGNRGGFALPLQTAALLPSCALLASQGPAGFALAGILSALFFVIRAPLKSFFIELRLARKPVYSISGAARIKRYIYAEKKTLCAALAMFFAICIIGKLNMLYSFFAALFLFISAAASVYLETRPRGAAAHIRFAPVVIRPKVNRRLPLIALPFMLASAAALVIPFFTRNRALPLDTSVKYEIPEISVKDYEDHISFQKNFAFMKLPSAEGAAGAGGAYLDFEIGPDGLLRTVDAEPLDYAASARAAGGSDADIPPFPLEKLLNSFNTEGVSTPFVFDIRKLIAIALSLAVYLAYAAFAVFGIGIGNGKKEKNRLYLNERMIA